MITAILADDEPMILKGLEKLIDWEKIGVEILGMANDGLEAMAMIHSLNPDMVISDINMPNFSGIEVLKKLSEEGSSTKVIFISGYQEFEYARDALKFGAVDYLIKPINEKQLIQAIQKIMTDTHEENSHGVTLELHLDHTSNVQNMEDEIFKTKRHLENSHAYYGALCCCFDDETGHEDDEKEIIMFSMMNIIEDLLDGVKDHWVINKNHDVYIMLYNEEMEEVESLMSILPRKIIQTFQQETHQSVSVSMSHIVNDIDEIRTVFGTAKERMAQQYFYNKGSVLNHSGQHKRRYTLEDHYKAQVAILDSITSYSKSQIEKSVKFYMDIVKDVSLWDKKSSLNYCLATLVFIQQQLLNSAVVLEPKDFEKVKAKFVGTRYYSQLTDEMILLCGTFLEEIIANARVRQNEEITKVKDYIQDHYSEPIKLETLADLVFMNPNYFSGYFKKHVGMKFKEYITNYRINEAEKLMLSTNYKVYEIAEAVGFGDYRHFSEVFKRIKGQSPSDYKKRIMNA